MLAFGFIIGSAAPVIPGWMKSRMGRGVGLSSPGFVDLLSAFPVFIGLRFTFHRDYQPDPSATAHE